MVTPNKISSRIPMKKCTHTHKHKYIKNMCNGPHSKWAGAFPGNWRAGALEAKKHGLAAQAAPSKRMRVWFTICNFACKSLSVSAMEDDGLSLFCGIWFQLSLKYFWSLGHFWIEQQKIHHVISLYEDYIPPKRVWILHLNFCIIMLLLHILSTA